MDTNYSKNQPIKHAGGRPTKYEPSFIQKAREYIDSCGREATELPTIEGLALTLQVDDTTILKWGEDNPEFLATIKELKQKQKNQLINDGMYGGKEVNSTMAIFLLKANHGLIETDRHELTGANGQPITITAARGFIPPGASVVTAPDGHHAIESPKIQSGSVAPEGA